MMGGAVLGSLVGGAAIGHDVSIHGFATDFNDGPSHVDAMILTANYTDHGEMWSIGDVYDDDAPAGLRKYGTTPGQGDFATYRSDTMSETELDMYKTVILDNGGYVDIYYKLGRGYGEHFMLGLLSGGSGGTITGLALERKVGTDETEKKKGTLLE